MRRVFIRILTCFSIFIVTNSYIKYIIAVDLISIEQPYYVLNSVELLLCAQVDLRPMLVYLQ